MKPGFNNVTKNQYWLLLLIVHCVSGSPPKKLEDEYDFIVVGGGTSGCAVAARLVETGVYKVLLVEAGGLAEPEWQVPGLAFEKIQNPSPNVQVYYSIPQNNAALSENGTVTYMAGRVIGGSSAINGMYYNRGNVHDYSRWARESFDESWSYKNLLPFFKKSENYSGQFPSDQHGYKGPISVTSSNHNPGIDIWLQAGKELGYPMADPNGPQKISFAPIEYTQDNDSGFRVSSYDGYLKPLLESNLGKNLHILLNTEATKINFDGRRAVEIEYKTNSSGQFKFSKVRASKEIILTAGVVGSPVLLLRSGIGPRPFLNATQIPVVQYLTGVGKNLQDHVSVGVPIILNDKSMVYNAVRDLTPKTWELFNATGTGPYASYGGFTGQAFLASPKPSTNRKSGSTDGWPDTHMILQLNASPNRFTGEYRDDLEGELKDGEVLSTLYTLVGRPQSRGRITLDEENLSNPPIIDFRYLTNRADLQIAVEGMKTTMDIIKTSGFRKVGARLPRSSYPECKHLNLYSDDYWRCFIKYNTHSGLHGVGTCRFGPGPSDHQAVVDTQLRVIGVLGLRVADAAVAPNIVNGNTMAAVYAIAEKAATMIINTWIPSANHDESNIADVEAFKTRYTLKHL